MTIFILAIFVGYFVVWSVTPALHTPLMSVTNAISGIIIVGAIIASLSGSIDNIFEISNIFGFLAILLAAISLGSSSNFVNMPENNYIKWLGFTAIIIASINIFGGFVVTWRMLTMFKKNKRKIDDN